MVRRWRLIGYFPILYNPRSWVVLRYRGVTLRTHKSPHARFRVSVQLRTEQLAPVVRFGWLANRARRLTWRVRMAAHAGEGVGSRLGLGEKGGEASAWKGSARGTFTMRLTNSDGSDVDSETDAEPEPEAQPEAEFFPTPPARNAVADPSQRRSSSHHTHVRSLPSTPHPSTPHLAGAPPLITHTSAPCPPPLTLTPHLAGTPLA
jgi:hypothetical protein